MYNDAYVITFQHARVPWSIVNIHEAINIHASLVQKESFKGGKTERNDIGLLQEIYLLI